MSCSPKFVTDPRPGFLPSPVSPSFSSSLSSLSRSKTDKTKHHSDYTPKHTIHSVSRHNRQRPSELPPHTLPEENYRYTLVTHGYAGTQASGEDSDYFHESTPGRAWRESKQAVPRVRISGFDINTPCPSKPGCTIDPAPCLPKQAPAPSVTSGSSRRFATPDRSDDSPRQELRIPADKPRISQFSASPIPHHRVKTRKHSFAYESDLRRKTLTKAS